MGIVISASSGKMKFFLMCFVSAASLIAAAPSSSEDRADDCVTINGPQKGVKCVFPFKARGKEYTKCTKAGNYQAAWCSTKTDDNGDTVIGNYGDCSDKCPVEDDASQTKTTPCVTINGPQKGAKCVFPFKARGKEYTKCTKAGNYEAAWCSTKTDDNGNTLLGNYGDCSEDCPVEDDASQTKTPPCVTINGPQKGAN